MTAEELLSHFGGDLNAAQNWVAAFEQEHGGQAPWEDEELLRKGISPQDALREHLAAKQWGEQFHRDFGRVPTHYDYRHDQPRRYYNADNEEGYAMAGGFGGYPPERLAYLDDLYSGMGGRRGGGGNGRVPRPPMFSLAVLGGFQRGY